MRSSKNAGEDRGSKSMRWTWWRSRHPHRRRSDPLRRSTGGQYRDSRRKRVSLPWARGERMRHAVRTFLPAAVVALALRPASGQELSELSLPPGGNGISQRSEVAQWIGPVKVSIAYGSPNVHGRGSDRAGHIWGELVPFGLFDEGFGPSTATPWRAGANESTTISFSDDVRVGGKEIK